MRYFEMDSIKEITAEIFGYIGIVSISLELILMLMIINMIFGITHKLKKCFRKCCIQIRNYFSNNSDTTQENHEIGSKNFKIDQPNLLQETEKSQLLPPVIEENITISRKTKWQNYIQTQLIQTGLAEHAVICDQNGMIWAKSENMNVDVEELKILIINHNNGKLLNGNSILINGVRFTCSSGASKHVSSNTVTYYSTKRQFNYRIDMKSCVFPAKILISRFFSFLVSFCHQNAFR